MDLADKPSRFRRFFSKIFGSKKVAEFQKAEATAHECEESLMARMNARSVSRMEKNSRRSFASNSRRSFASTSVSSMAYDRRGSGSSALYGGHPSGSSFVYGGRPVSGLERLATYGGAAYGGSKSVSSMQKGRRGSAPAVQYGAVQYGGASSSKGRRGSDSAVQYCLRPRLLIDPQSEKRYLVSSIPVFHSSSSMVQNDRRLSIKSIPPSFRSMSRSSCTTLASIPEAPSQKSALKSSTSIKKLRSQVTFRDEAESVVESESDTDSQGSSIEERRRSVLEQVAFIESRRQKNVEKTFTKEFCNKYW